MISKKIIEITENLDSKRKPLNNIKRNKMKDNPIYPYYGANGLVDYIDDYIYDEEILCVAEDGGSWGLKETCAYIVEGKSWVNNHAHVLKTTEEVDIRYLMHYLNYSDLGEYITGTTRGKLTKTALNRIKIILPPLQTQMKIVEALDKAQDLIDLRKEQMELLDELIQSVFYDMFGDPVTNLKGWEKKKLIKIADIVTGNTPSRKKLEYYGTHIDWIKSNNINTPYEYITDAEEQLSIEGEKVGRVVEKNSILMTCIAGSIGCIGNVAITNKKVAFNQQINAIVPHNSNTYFIYTLMLLSKEFIQGQSTNSMKGMLSKGKMSEIEFITPDINIQNKFGKIFERCYEQKQLMQESLTEMENNFNSLMQRAFKGELFD